MASLSSAHVNDIGLGPSTSLVGGQHCGRCATKEGIVVLRIARGCALLPWSRWRGRVQPRLLLRRGSRSRPSTCGLRAWPWCGGRPRAAGTESGLGERIAAAASRRRRGATRRPRGERLLLRGDGCDRELLFESVCGRLRERSPMPSLRPRLRGRRAKAREGTAGFSSSGARTPCDRGTQPRRAGRDRTFSQAVPWTGVVGCLR